MRNNKILWGMGAVAMLAICVGASADWADVAKVIGTPTIIADATNRVNDPNVATNGNGVVIAAWETEEALGKVMSVTSTDSGATWGTPVTIFTSAIALESHTLPHVATDGFGTWVCSWCDNEAGTGTDEGRQMIARSTNNGATWSTAVQLNPATTHVAAEEYINGNDSHGFADVAMTFTGKVMIAWCTDADNCVAVYSSNKGLSWAPISLVNRTDYIHMAVNDENANPTWIIIGEHEGLWASSGYNTSVYTAAGEITPHPAAVYRSTDNGATWTATVLSGTDEIDEFSDITYAGGGKWIALANLITGTQRIMAYTSTDDGLTWDAGVVARAGVANFLSLTTNEVGLWSFTYDLDSATQVGCVISPDDGASWLPQFIMLDGTALPTPPGNDGDDPSSVVLGFTPAKAFGLSGDTQLLTVSEVNSNLVAQVSTFTETVHAGSRNYIGAPLAGVLGLGVLSSVLALAGAALVRKQK